MTNDEEKFHAAIRELGCIVCLKTSGKWRGCDIHHILSGGRRKGEMFVLGLCPEHHRVGLSTGFFISRHPYKARFESAYGTEEDLLSYTREQLLLRGHNFLL